VLAPSMYLNKVKVQTYG